MRYPNKTNSKIENPSPKDNRNVCIYLPQGMWQNVHSIIIRNVHNHKVVKCLWKQKEYIVAYPHNGRLQGNEDEIKETSKSVHMNPTDITLTKMPTYDPINAKSQNKINQC